MVSRFRLPFLIASVALLLFAIAAVAVVTDEVALGREDDNPVVEEGQDLLSGSAISLDEAIAAAQAEASGPVDDIEVERRGDQLVYDIEIGNTDVVVDAADASIVSVQTDEDDDDRDDDDRREDSAIAQDVAGAISVDDAIKAAQAVASGTVTDVELDHEDGRLVYSIEIGREEVEIDALNGDVLSVEVDD